ncbi:hypothetical protein Dimus_017305 [Dionaea muscipula]
MDFNIVKAEKSKAMKRLHLHRLRRIAKLFRFVELCVLLAFLSWFSTRLPFAVKIFCRWLAGVVVSPLFVFAVGNGIVVTLMAKSGQFSGKGSNAADREALFRSLRSEASSEPVTDPKAETEPEEIVYEDKEMICQKQHTATVPVTASATKQLRVDDALQWSGGKVDPDLKLQRSQSENLERETTEKCLRRSETDIASRMESNHNNGKESENDDKVFPEDGLSSEEFRRTIEAFIAKQKKFRREESQRAPDLPSSSSPATEPPLDLAGLCWCGVVTAKKVAAFRSALDVRLLGWCGALKAMFRLCRRSTATLRLGRLAVGNGTGGGQRSCSW